MALHCPATLLVAATPRGEEARELLLESLASERVLTVVSAPGDDEGRRLAEVLGVPLEDEPGLASADPDDSVLGAVADLHRGETVLVLAGPSGAGETPFARLEVD